MTDRVREAAQELCSFAFSALKADCREAAVNLNRLVSNLRAALASEAGVSAATALQIGDKVKVADTAEYWSDWKGWEGFISGIRTSRTGVPVYETCDAWPPAEKVERTDGFVRADLVALSRQQPAAEAPASTPGQFDQRFLVGEYCVRQNTVGRAEIPLDEIDLVRRGISLALEFCAAQPPSPQKTEG